MLVTIIRVPLVYQLLTIYQGTHITYFTNSKTNQAQNRQRPQHHAVPHAGPNQQVIHHADPTLPKLQHCWIVILAPICTTIVPLFTRLYKNFRIQNFELCSFFSVLKLIFVAFLGEKLVERQQFFCFNQTLFWSINPPPLHPPALPFLS